MVKLLFLSVALTLCLFSPATGSSTNSGPEDKKTIVVAVTEFKPTVIKKGNSFTGFEIELFEAQAQLLGLNYKYLETDFTHRFELLKNGTADVSISGSTITAERESSGLDFSHRNLDSGLRIMVRKNDNYGTMSFFKSLLDPGVVKIFAALIVFCVLMGGLFIYVENRNNAKAFTGGFLRNTITGAYWALVTASTVGYGDVTPKTSLGKIITKATILGGIAIFGLYIGAVSSINFKQQLESTIEKPADLSGRTVATVADTTSIKTLEDLNAVVTTTHTAEEAYNLLLNKRVDAVVFDSPALMYFAEHEGADKVSLVGPLFDRQDYGLAFPEGSPLREKFNRALLLLQKNGFYDDLHKKYFGE